MSYVFATILGGIIAASGFIIARKPNAKDLIDKVTPYQGWLGVGLFAWGIYWLVFYVLANFGALTSVPLQLTVILAVLVSGTGVGFLLGFGLISKYALNRNEIARQKGQALREKLVAIQVPLGFAAIASGVAAVVLI